MAKSRHRRRPPPAISRRAAGGGAGAAEAWHRQALAAYAARDYGKAIGGLEKAIALVPRAALWHTQLGVVLRALGRLSEAIAAHRRAIALDPALAAAHNNLGNALRANGEADAAEAELREALRLEPRYAEAYLNLAELLRERRRLAEAEAMCRRALELKPDYVPARRELGSLCLWRDDFAGAEACFRAVTDAVPSDTEAYLALAGALEGEARFEEADEVYERVVALAPDHAGAHFARAHRLQQKGDAAGAALHYRGALARQPRLASAYLSLANLPGTGLGADEKREIERLLALPDLPDDDRSTLCYALARAAEREEDWDKAFGFARLANEIDHTRTAFDEGENLAFVRRTIAVFSAGFRDGLPQGSASEKPVFILGMPRSGTTLVEEILASHPQVAAAGELTEIPQIADGLAADIGSSRPYPECVLELDEARAQAFSERYLLRLDRVSRTALYVTDKLPFNFRHLGLIAALFPKARIIHCRRDPRDVAVSCYFIKFQRPVSFACDLFELGAYLRHTQMLMTHWRQVLGGQMLEIDYEALVTEPEREARRLIDFCGLPWHENLLKFHEADRLVRTASASQVRRPIYRSSIGRWRRFGKYLLPLLAELEGRRALAPPPRPPAP